MDFAQSGNSQNLKKILSSYSSLFLAQILCICNFWGVFALLIFWKAPDVQSNGINY